MIGAPMTSARCLCTVMFVYGRQCQCSSQAARRARIVSNSPYHHHHGSWMLGSLACLAPEVLHPGVYPQAVMSRTLVGLRVK